MTQFSIESTNSDSTSTFLDLGPMAAPDHTYLYESIATAEDVYHQMSVDLAH